MEVEILCLWYIILWLLHNLGQLTTNVPEAEMLISKGVQTRKIMRRGNKYKPVEKNKLRQHYEYSGVSQIDNEPPCRK